MNTDQSRMSFYEINVGFLSDGDAFPKPLGVWRGLAADAVGAKSKAYDEHWDSRLDTTSCTPWCSAKCIDEQRFLVSEGWGHIFVGQREDTTRWVYDRAANAFVDAQVMNGATGAWTTLDEAARADLLGSLGDNELLERQTRDFDLATMVDQFGDLELSGRPPAWVAQTAFAAIEVARPRAVESVYLHWLNGPLKPDPTCGSSFPSRSSFSRVRMWAIRSGSRERIAQSPIASRESMQRKTSWMFRRKCRRVARALACDTAAPSRREIHTGSW